MSEETSRIVNSIANTVTAICALLLTYVVLRAVSAMMEIQENFLEIGDIGLLF